MSPKTTMTTAFETLRTARPAAVLGTLRGGKFTIERLAATDADGRPMYLIKGRRSAVYGLIRNYYSPDRLFVTPLYGTGRTPFDGVWFTETETQLTNTDGDAVAL